MDAIRLLVAEDNPDDYELMLFELEQAGFTFVAERVDTAAEFQRALEESWDVILSDFYMPDFTAPQALERLQQSKKDIPMIIVSGSVGEDLAVEAMRAGARDFFPKSKLTRLPVAVEREIRDARQRSASEAQRADLVEELQLAVQSRDDFLSIASHELRTPLTSLRLSLETLRVQCEREPELPLAAPEVERSMAMLNRQCERLEFLTRNLLDVARITSGAMALEPSRVDLRVMVDVSLDRLKRWIERSGSEVVVDAPGSVPGRWDRERLSIAIDNLLTNALKFGREQPITIRIEDEGARVRLSVTDRGIGMSPDDQHRIFDRFSRAVSARNYGGFGVGLWIVRQVAEAHGGTISVESALDEGTTITLELPRADA